MKSPAWMLALPLALTIFGAMVVGGSLMSHTPWLYDLGWIKGVFIGGLLTAWGVEMTVSAYLQAMK